VSSLFGEISGYRGGKEGTGKEKIRLASKKTEGATNLRMPFADTLCGKRKKWGGYSGEDERTVGGGVIGR